MRATERERHDWIIISIIVLIGFLSVVLAGQWALRFSPSWELAANMESQLDPNSDFLTNRSSGFIEPIDPSILTQPAWIDHFLTPGAEFSTETSMPMPVGTSFTASPITPTPFTTTTPVVSLSMTNTSIVILSPTNTLYYYPPAPSSTPRPKPPSTPTATPTYTFTPTATFTPTPTVTPTDTPTSTATLTSTPTPTNTPDPIEPDFGGPDGNMTTLGNGTWIEFNLSGFVLDGNSTWDAVYYEMEETSAAGKIHMGAVHIEVYDQTTSAWYTIYNWGDGTADTNASHNNGNSEPDGFPIDTSLLYGTAPLNTGIAIDIDTRVIAQGGTIGDSITSIRITSLSNANCDVDSLQRLR